MQASNTPSKVLIPFAQSGTYNAIPLASQIGVTPGRASMATGFPPLTFTPISAGGIPPFGSDFNGILNAITAVQQWQSGGGMFAYDSAWSTQNGGYPKGAIVLKSAGPGYWACTVDNNTSNPDSAGAGWVDLGALLTTGPGGCEVVAQLKSTNTGSQNDTALLAAAAICQAMGGGTVILPPGTFVHTNCVWNPATYPKVSIRGSGKLATILTKTDSSTTPLLDFSASSLVEWFGRMSDFQIVVANGALSSGLRTTLVGIFNLHNIQISGAAIGWENVGSLIASVYDCDFLGNTIGYQQSRSSPSMVYPNLITFYGGQCLSNTSMGFNFIHGNGITLDHVDIETNGVNGNAATGGVFIRSTTNLEVSFTQFTICNNTWFEGNKGSGLTVETTSNLMLHLSDVHFYRSATTDAVTQINIGAIESVVMTNVFAVSALSGGITTSISGASRSTITGGQFTTLTDTSTSTKYNNVATSTQLIADQSSLGANHGGHLISQVYPVNGSTAAIQLPLQVLVDTGAGCIMLITGADTSGVAYARAYLVALEVGSGASPAFSSVLMGTTGSTTPTWTFSVSGGYLVASVASGNTARLAFTGMT